jgi:hypothetical protein
MRLIQAKVDDGSLENWRKRISITPVLKSFRVRPVDVDFDGENCNVTIMDLKDSKTFGWDLFNTDQLIEQLSEIGISVDRIETKPSPYGIDLSFTYKVNI